MHAGLFRPADLATTKVYLLRKWKGSGLSVFLCIWDVAYGSRADLIDFRNVYSGSFLFRFAWRDVWLAGAASLA
jgi:hypothetical protein